MAMSKNSHVRMAEQKAKEADAKVIQARANYFPEAAIRPMPIHAGRDGVPDHSGGITRHLRRHRAAPG